MFEKPDELHSISDLESNYFINKKYLLDQIILKNLDVWIVAKNYVGTLVPMIPDKEIDYSLSDPCQTKISKGKGYIRYIRGADGNDYESVFIEGGVYGYWRLDPTGAIETATTGKHKIKLLIPTQKVVEEHTSGGDNNTKWALVIFDGDEYEPITPDDLYFHLPSINALQKRKTGPTTLSLKPNSAEHDKDLQQSLEALVNNHHGETGIWLTQLKAATLLSQKPAGKGKSAERIRKLTLKTWENID